MPSASVATAMLNARFANNRRSINGWRNARCLRRKTTANSSPTVTKSTGNQPGPSAAICLRP